MIKKLLFLMLICLIFVPSVSAADYNTMRSADFQGYLYLNQTITFSNTPLQICQMANPAYTKMAGVREIGLGRATLVTSGQNLMGANVTWGTTKPFVSDGQLQKWLWGDSWNASTYPHSYPEYWVVESATCDPVTDAVTGRWWIMRDTPVPPIVPVTFIVRDFNTMVLLPNVSVFISNGQSGLTNSTGVTTINITPNSSVYTYYMTKSGYVASYPVALSTIGETGGTIYATLTAGGIGDYYITVSPAWIPAGGTQYLYGQLRKYGTSETNLTEFKTISWQWKKWMPENQPSQMYPYYDVTNSNYWVSYQKQPSEIYNGWSGLTNAFTYIRTASLPNPVSLNPIGATGTIITYLYAYDIYGNNYEFNTSNLIGDNTTGNNYIKYRVADAYTGGLIGFSKINFKNELTSIWYNITAQTGEYQFDIPVGVPYTVNCQASGYQNITQSDIVGINTTKTCHMYASGYVGSLNKTQLIIYTNSVPIGNGNSLPIADAYVTVTQLNESISKSDYSDTNGITRLSANVSTKYTITGSKVGYLSASQTIDTMSVNPYEVYLFLGNPYTTTSITYTPIPTATVRPTLIGGGERNLTSAICGAESTNIVQMFKNHIACWGVEERTAQDLVLAGIIIAFFAFVMSKWGKGLGAIIGASVGFILSLAAGLIPVWAFFALVIIAGLIFGLKLYGGGK